jgi:hypothetical protein
MLSIKNNEVSMNSDPERDLSFTNEKTVEEKVENLRNDTTHRKTSTFVNTHVEIEIDPNKILQRKIAEAMKDINYTKQMEETSESTKENFNSDDKITNSQSNEIIHSEINRSKMEEYHTLKERWRRLESAAFNCDTNKWYGFLTASINNKELSEDEKKSIKIASESKIFE